MAAIVGDNSAEALWTYRNMNRASYLIENQIGKGDVFIARTWIALKLDGASVDLIQHAVGDGDVLGKAAAKTEDGPPGTEDAIADRHELTTAEEGTGIVLRKHDAVTDGQILCADEMEAVVIAIHAAVNIDAVHVHALALDHAEAVICAIKQIDIADRETFAPIGEQMIGAAAASETAGRLGTAHGRVKLKSLAINRAGSFESNVSCVDDEEESPVAVNQRCVATQGNGFHGVILFSVGASQ